MMACVQFTQYKIAKFVKYIPNLSYFDFARSTDTTFASAFCIASTLKKVELLNFSPAFISEQYQDWKRLVIIFQRIHFGVDVMRFFPLNGQGMRSLPDVPEM